MAYLLIAWPLLMGVLAFAVRSDRWRPWLLPAGTLGQLILVFFAMGGGVSSPPITGLGGWLLLDSLGKVVLGFLAVLYFLCSLYAPAYLALRRDRPNRVFCANMFASLAMMTLVTLSHHLGLMWVAMEATTLVSAPAIYFNHNARSLEATWKYLLIGSVGIALALLGSFFLAYSSLKAGLESTLLFDQLIKDAPRLSSPWLHAAFVLLFVGYGTKMGLAPMHSWKPDAYGEAPGMVGALLAGGVTSCAFLAILRVYQICSAGTEAESARRIMVAMGLFSMAVAAVFMARQRDFKRMLAYSSVEHMGILVLGVGLGGAAVYGALLHMINNGLTKGVLFLSAGNIHRAFGSKVTTDVRGAIQRVPLSGALFLAGFLAITGAPPFGPFVSEFTIASAGIVGGHYVVVGLFLLLLAVVFLGMGATVLDVVQGKPLDQRRAGDYHDSAGTCVPIVIFMGLVLLMGLSVPQPLDALLREAAGSLEVKR
ncbi:MAG: proton-conducting transporter membrane subunit [Paludisphaera borealis]|uniref:proton-conducting transporter transmembrane domain-containing protein n=1 Tax=Paludisphaera borealis TaxID=1387353 RepID=UPI002848B727|nr:proton-conducting transporter membrane subunit [Paludisphaera borealis]MDR3618601.1 proton-conducting transporter membrane subunit [Paludisphaera borealis]